jgi:hypothetical protein
LPRVDTPVEQAHLDTAAGAAIGGALDALQTWDRFRPMIAEYMEAVAKVIQEQTAYAKTYSPADHDNFVREVHSTINSLFGQLDKLSRVTLSMAKAADTVARLRVFLDGGERPDDLSKMSISELVKVVRGTASMLQGNDE